MKNLFSASGFVVLEAIQEHLEVFSSFAAGNNQLLWKLCETFLEFCGSFKDKVLRWSILAFGSSLLNTATSESLRSTELTRTYARYLSSHLCYVNLINVPKSINLNSCFVPVPPIKMGQMDKTSCMHASRQNNLPRNNIMASHMSTGNFVEKIIDPIHSDHPRAI